MKSSLKSQIPRVNLETRKSKFAQEIETSWKVDHMLLNKQRIRKEIKEIKKEFLKPMKIQTHYTKTCGILPKQYYEANLW